MSTVERIAFRPRIGLAELRGGESSEPSEEQLRAHSARNEDDDEARGIFRDVTHAVGVVPIVGLHRVSRICHAHTCFLKLESCNPGGSIKEKNAVNLVDRAEEEGKLRPGGVIVESSSGNFGIGLAMVGAVRGYKVIIVVDAKTQPPIRRMLKAYGAELSTYRPARPTRTARCRSPGCGGPWSSSRRFLELGTRAST